MKKSLSAWVALVTLIAVALTLRTPRNTGAFDLVEFGRLPVLVNGRIKPLDTVARTTLLTLQGRQRVVAADGADLAPAAWLLDVFFKPEAANRCATFAIVHPEVLALFNLTPADARDGKRFALAQLAGGLGELERQAKLADDTDGAARTPFQRAVVQLRDNVVLYQRLQGTFVPASEGSFWDAVEPAPGRVELDAAKLAPWQRAFATMDALSLLRPIPPDAAGADPMAWRTPGSALIGLEHARGTLDAIHTFLALGRAWRDGQAPAFNRAVGDYQARLDAAMPARVRKCGIEARFNAAQPFYTSALLYVLAFLAAIVSWLKWGPALASSAFVLLRIAFVLTSAGVFVRMWLEARPPVTNLYSSALFVGWCAVALCVFLEKLYRNALGSAAGGLIGFATLIIAHHLALSGDTLEMMRAVLDSNFWLATHVVTISVGYSATFLAGFLALIYIVRGVLTRTLDAATAAALSRMIYGVVCFATLFSFVGTILGGIWADQSWGRFWGWDPKENGALIIVIWNSIILHARWAGLVRARGLACLALFGNVVTAWSWFGVNMLGVGLHSYGFMASAFWWLIAFVLSQLAIIALAAVPHAKWRSRLAA